MKLNAAIFFGIVAVSYFLQGAPHFGRKPAKTEPEAQTEYATEEERQWALYQKSLIEFPEYHRTALWFTPR